MPELICPSDESQLRFRARQLIEARQYAQALECLRERLLACPEDGQALNDVGTILFTMGRFDEAIRHLKSALNFPDTPRGVVLNNLAEVYISAGRAPEAADLLDALSDEDSLSADIVNRVTCALLEAGDHHRAVETLRISLNLMPDRQHLAPIIRTVRESSERQMHDDIQRHFRILKELGDCYVSLGDSEKAADAYDQAARLMPDDPGPHVGMGILAVQAERHDEAIDAFKSALQKDDSCAEAYGGMAMVYQQTQDYHAAFDMYLKCLELDRENLVALLGLFQTSCRMGTFSHIIHYLRLYLDSHPGDIAVLFCLASLYVKEGQLERAREILCDVLALEPDKVEALELLETVENRIMQSASGGVVNA